MANGQLDLVLQHIRKVAGCQEWSDGDLLERFVALHEEAVFEVLLKRHGPLVLGVCQRVLQQEQDAEDAFQATFLVLARRAGSIRKRASLGSWLYGVAYRLSLKVKANAARRRARERRVAAMSQPELFVDDLAWRELRPVLDQELQRLPDKYRTPLVLCYLEGKTHTEAAQALGWPVGSLAKRLNRAKELLRVGLLKRGVTLSSGLLAVLLAEKTRAALPTALIESSRKAAVLVALGQAVTGVVSTEVATLAEGAVRTMLLTKLKIGFVVLMGVALLAVATGLADPRKPLEETWTDLQDEQPAIGARAERPADLKHIPVNALGFIRIAVRDLWASPAMQKIRQQSAGNGVAAVLQDMEKHLGIKIDDLEAISVMLLPGETPQGPPSSPAVLFTTIKPYARERVYIALTPGTQEQSFGGITFYAGQHPESTALTYLSERTFLMTTKSTLQRYAGVLKTSNGGQPLAASLKLAEQNHAIVGGFHVPPYLAQLMKREPLPPPAAFLSPLFDLENGSLTVDFNGQAQARIQLHFASDEAAEKAADALQTGVGVLKQLVAAVPNEARQDPLAAALLQEATSDLRTVRVTQQKSGVQVAAQGDTATLLSSVLPGIQKTRLAAARTVDSNNLKQMVIALHNYHATYNHLPPATIADKDGKPLLSWRVAILPYIEQEALYRQFHLDEPWDSEHNSKLLEKMPQIYAIPNHPAKEPSATYYQVFTGKGTPFDNPIGNAFTDITDGLSNTLMIVEAARAVPWTKPEDLTYAADKALPKLGGVYAEGFMAAFCDGSVQFISKNTSEQKVRALITRNGGEIVEHP
jgi:RNA polymerase sigma factor (sigma-70 family)